jgi:hypothetical protein
VLEAMLSNCKKRLKRGKQKLYISGQTIQWPTEKRHGHHYTKQLRLSNANPITKTGLNSGALAWLAVPAPLVAPVVL